MKTIIITLVLITSNPHFPRSEFPRFMADFKSAYEKQLPAHVLLTQFARAKPCERFNSLDILSRLRRLRCYEGRAGKLKTTHRGPVLFLVAPMNHNGQLYMGGMANANRWNCDKGTGWSTVELYNSRGEDRYPHSLTAAAHELGHLLGAQHTNEKDAMNLDALVYVGSEPLSYGAAAVQTLGRFCE